MIDMKCDVCNTRPAIGVASTAIPLSVAYCEECARRNAQPECVFVYWEDEIGEPKNHRAPDHMFTYENGKYISYRKWYNARHVKGARTVHIKTPEGSGGSEPEVPKGD
jgi:hypothetical protein